MGLPAPVTADRLPQVHGMLLVLGFVGTLVALERAVALARAAALLAPALLGVGGVLLLTPAPLVAGRAALCVGTLALVTVYVPLWRRQRDEAVLVQALGAVHATGAAALWLGGATTAATLPWLCGFVVLTIAGERLELARLTMGRRGGSLVLLAAALSLAVLAALLWPAVGTPLLGVTLAGLVVWLARHDVARHTARATGVSRFMAVAMLSGYLWLAVAAAVWSVGGPVTEGPAYDAVVHAVFLGFTLSMIMAHAPVILPSVLRRPAPYSSWCWLPLALLHSSLLLRVWGGDGLGLAAAREVGGALNVVAVLLFVLVTAVSAASAVSAGSTASTGAGRGVRHRGAAP
jgi:hypothetical protein